MIPLLDIRDLDIPLPNSAERAFAIRDLSLRLHADQILCVVGESGSGKSTLALSVMGLLPPPLSVTRGIINLSGKDLRRCPRAEIEAIRGAKIGMIFQEPLSALNPLMKAGDQIAETFTAHKALKHKAAFSKAIELLERMGLPDPERAARSYPFQLSGGQRQRVLIAAALALEPGLLIADEPTTALDVTTQAQILQLIREQQKNRRLGVLFITHDFGVVSDIADEIAVMRSGRIVETGPAAALLSEPENSYTKALIAAVPPLAPPGPRNRAPSEVVLEVKGVAKRFFVRKGWFRRDELDAVQDVSFSLKRGETYGLVGESGSGKSTLGRMIVGLIPPDDGKVLLNGEDLDARERMMRRKIQMVFQDPYGSLNPRRKISETLTAGSIAQGESREAARERAEELLSLVRLGGDVMERYPHEFSGGQRQRIGIARALMARPEILVADEAVSALDVSIQEQVVKLFADIRDRLHLSTLFITHDLRIAGQICDRIGVLRQGRLIEEGTPQGILLSPKTDYAKALVAAIPGREWR